MASLRGHLQRHRVTKLITTGKSSARFLMQACIFLKADASEAGECWSGGAIAAAINTVINTVGLVRKQLLEEGLDAVLTRKHSPTLAR